MDRFGWKYNMTNIQAAMLIPQLDRIEERLGRREVVAEKYEAAFREAGIGFPDAGGEGERSARHLFTVWAPSAELRDPLLVRLREAGVGCAVNYRPIHLTSYYRERFGFSEGSFPAAESIGARTISLPMFPGLRDDEVDHVIEAVRSSWDTT